MGNQQERGLYRKVPKGVLTTPSLIFGITLEQFMGLAVVGVIFSVIMFLSSSSTAIYVLAAGAVVVTLLYAVLNICNTKDKGFLSEYLRYYIRKIRYPQRYTG